MRETERSQRCTPIKWFLLLLGIGRVLCAADALECASAWERHLRRVGPDTWQSYVNLFELKKKQNKPSP